MPEGKFPLIFPFKFTEFGKRFVRVTDIDDTLEFYGVDDSITCYDIPDSLMMATIVDSTMFDDIEDTIQFIGKEV